MDQNKYPGRYKAKLQLYNERPHFGAGVCRLLELIRQGGSLRSACKEMNMSYSKAWKLFQEAEKDLGYALTVGEAGGSGGGGTKLTQEGEEMLDKYLEFLEKSREALDRVFLECFGHEPKNGKI